MKNIAVYGCGGLGREIKMLIEDINKTERCYNFIGFFDDGVETSTIINNSPILGNIEDLNCWNKGVLYIIIALGNPMIKKLIISKIKNKLIVFPTLIHPSAIIGNDDVFLGKGTVICARCVITVNIKIADHVTLGIGSLVGHDTSIEDFSSIMPGVNISGFVKIKKCVYIGTGATIINVLEIGEETVIGAGAVVTKNLPPFCTAVGVPAVPIKFFPSKKNSSN